MKQHLPFIVLLFIISFASCRGSKYSTKSDEKDLATLVKRLNKKGGDDNVIADLQEVYGNAREKSNGRLANYRYLAAPQKWDNIIPEMEGLQRMYETISKSAYALRLVNPENIYPRLIAAKDSAASDYYEYGMQQLNQQSREHSKEAYYAFQKTIRYVPNYRDAKLLMRNAYERSIVQVLVNYIQYDDFAFNNWNWNQYSSNDRMTHSNLLRDLGGTTAAYIPARFFDEYTLRRENRAPDIVVDLVWRNLHFDYPRDRTRSYSRSKQIETGRDTANKPIYQTVNATVQVTERELTANADMNLIITDAASRMQLRWDRLPADYRYTYEFADYSGDKRALDTNDWTMINRNRNQPMPSKEDAMTEMMRKVYNDLVNRIKTTVSW